MVDKAKVWILENEGLAHDKEMAIYEKNNISYKLSTMKTFERDFKEFGKNADALVVQVGFQCDAELINRLENCKGIFTFGMGYNNVDLQAAKEMGIYVCNVPDYCQEEVADHSLSLALTLIRRLFAYNKKVKKGMWDSTDTEPISRLSQTVVGLYGFGQIAREVARRFKPFGVKLIAHDRFVDKDAFATYGVTPVSFDSLLKQSNILSLHVPLTKGTKNSLHYDNMAMLPKGAIIINTCRGGVIQEEDLARLLNENHLSGAGLDVLLNEPPEKDNELVQLENTIITPHAAYYSTEAQEELQIRTAENVVRLLSKKKPNNIVQASL